jgi:hypothetical protein
MSENDGKPTRLLRGPFYGAEVPRSTNKILLSGEPLPDGTVARYRFSAGADAYVFVEYDTVILIVPGSR